MMAWFRGWLETARIYFFDRETYDFLVNGRFDEDDFVEVDRPGSN